MTADPRKVPKLIEENPVLFRPSLARALGDGGIAKAIILERIYWLAHSGIGRIQDVNGRRYVYYPLPSLAGDTALSRATVNRQIRELETEHLVERAKLRQGNNSQAWYWVDVDEVRKRCSLFRVGPECGESTDSRLELRRGESQVDTRRVAKRDAKPSQNETHSIKREEGRELESPVSGAAAADELPEGLRTSQFISAWIEWEQHRRESRHKLTPSTRRRQLAQCLQWGPTRAAEAIEQSIANGWQGLFEPKGVKNNGSARRLQHSEGLTLPN